MNPVLRENLAVFFGERHVLPIYSYLLIFLAPIAWGTVYTQSLGEQMWRGSGSLLKVCASAAFVLIVYFASRMANQEYAAERFKPLGHWLRDGNPSTELRTGRAIGVLARGRVAFLAVHVACLTALSAPLVVWAAAISRAPLTALVATLALIPFYGLCYGVWGLVASVLWEREMLTREFAVRLFIVFVLIAAPVIYLPLNPVIYIFAIAGGQELAPFTLAGVNLPAGAAHIAFHLVLGGAGLAAHRWALKRSLEHGRR